MEILKQIIKKGFSSVGLKVEWRDPMEELIPQGYHRSPFIPKVYRQTVGMVPYFSHMLDRVEGIEGDVVECGVSLGHGLMVFMLIESSEKRVREFHGFDSFEGFPDNVEHDRMGDGTFCISEGDYSTPPDLVLRTLSDGRVPEDLIQNNLHLHKGFFENTLSNYSGTIAFLHLDCDLYQSYMTCLNELYSKVAPGGLILFDEYEDETFPGARKAVDEFFTDKPEIVQEYKRYGYLKYFVVKQ